jgi:hypothetical protein
MPCFRKKNIQKTSEKFLIVATNVNVKKKKNKQTTKNRVTLEKIKAFRKIVLNEKHYSFIEE